MLILAVVFDAPLRSVANPTVTPNPEKAPWYFAALQELLAHFHPLIAGVLIPGAILIGLVALPYIDRSVFIRATHRRVAVTTFTGISCDLRCADHCWVRVPRSELGMGLAMAGMARRIVRRMPCQTK